METIIVTGKAGAGKTTHVKRMQAVGDLVFDMDMIGDRIGGFGNYPRPDDIASLLLAWRQSLIDAIKSNGINRRCWIIVSSKANAERIAEECGGRVVYVQ